MEDAFVWKKIKINGITVNKNTAAMLYGKTRSSSIIDNLYLYNLEMCSSYPRVIKLSEDIANSQKAKFEREVPCKSVKRRLHNISYG